MTKAKPEAPATCDNCGSERLERFEATAPDGAVLEILRCIHCAAERITPVGRNAGTGVGTAMVPGSSREAIGPEDALGPGPKRGDYSGRLGGVLSVESVPVEDPAPGAPRSRLVAQRARANDIGDEPAKKGGVTTTTREGDSQ